MLSRDGNFIISRLPRPIRVLLLKFSLALFILTCLLLFILLNDNQSALLLSVKNRFLSFTTPIVVALSKPLDMISHVRTTIDHYLFVYDQNEELRITNRRLKRQVSLMTRAASENTRLKKLLHYSKDIPFQFITARVVGDVSGPYVRAILINAGIKDGIKEGYAVVNDQGLIGRVVEVYHQTARILLLTDINSRIPAIAAQSGERTIVVGNNTSLLRLEYLLDDTDIQVGELLLTSGDGDLFPQGLEIGKIYQKNEDQFHVMPHMKSNRMQFVSILLPKTASKPAIKKE